MTPHPTASLNTMSMGIFYEAVRRWVGDTAKVRRPTTLLLSKV
jgi:hypothetical protein